MSDYYQILGIDKNASQDGISNAYRKKAKEFHPDLHPNDENAAKKFKEVAEAFEILGNPEKRQHYDRFGKSGPNFQGKNPFHGFDPFSVFAEHFGGNPWDVFVKTPQKNNGDIHETITIEFEEAINGCRKTIEITKKEQCEFCENGYLSWDTCSMCRGSGMEKTAATSNIFVSRTCSKCHGSKKMGGKKCENCHGTGFTDKEIKESITVDIPKGIDNDSVLSFFGKGNVANGEIGKLIVRIVVKPHKVFIRQGRTIFMELPLTYSQFVLGDKVAIPTINNEIVLTIDPGISVGTRLRLDKLGVNGGEMIVQLNLIIPKNPSEEYKNLLKNLQDLEGNFKV